VSKAALQTEDRAFCSQFPPVPAGGITLIQRSHSWIFGRISERPVPRLCGWRLGLNSAWMQDCSK